MRGAAVIVFLFCSARVVQAGSNDGIKVALHYTSTCDKCVVNACGDEYYNPNYSGVPCSSFDMRIDHRTSGPDVGYIVIVDADSTAGVSSFQFGIWFDQPAFVYSTSFWKGCGDMEFPHGSSGGDAWPLSGSGNRVVWEPTADCRRTVFGEDGVRVVVGAMTIDSFYGEYLGSFAVTPDSTLADPAFVVVDCAQQETRIKTPGGVLSTTPGAGYNPCLADSTVSVTGSTWGALKVRFRQ